LDLGASSLSGNLSVTTAGAITDSGKIVISGTTTLAAGSANSISLDSTDNDFGGAVVIASALNATLKDANALVLGASTLSGNLALSSGGALTESGAWTVVGTTTIASAGQDVTLAAANDFGGAVSVAAKNLDLRDKNALTLGTLSLSGGLNLSSGADLSGSGAVGVALATHIETAGHALSLSNAGNDFVGLVTVLEATNITLRDANALRFTGAATGSGSALSLSAGAALTLGVASSTGAMTLAGSSVALDQTSVAGALSVTAGSGAVTQATDKLVTVAGNTSLSGASIALTNANTFSGTVGLSTTGAAALRSTGALALAASSIGGNLALSAGGNITDGGVLSVTGTTT
ncbi:MAG: hypothetical protein ACR2I0_08875, partial [Rhodoferax sp.]